MKNKLYIIVSAETEVTEEGIVTIIANNKDDAIQEYAKEYIAKDKAYRSFLESREVKWGYPQIFRKEIGEFENSIKHRTDLTADDINTMTKENVKKYLDKHHQYTNQLFDFYTDNNKSVKDLDEELINILAAKFMHEGLFAYIIKEVVI